MAQYEYKYFGKYRYGDVARSILSLRLRAHLHLGVALLLFVHRRPLTDQHRSTASQQRHKGHNRERVPRHLQHDLVVGPKQRTRRTFAFAFGALSRLSTTAPPLRLRVFLEEVPDHV